MKKYTLGLIFFALFAVPVLIFCINGLCHPHKCGFLFFYYRLPWAYAQGYYMSPAQARVLKYGSRLWLRLGASR